jgi:hypothetical protein
MEAAEYLITHSLNINNYVALLNVLLVNLFLGYEFKLPEKGINLHSHFDERQ